MPFELDHVFLLVSPGAPEAESLSRCSLVEGPPNRHPGQGTACRRFFFSNIMLELLWVADEAEAQAAPGDRLRLAERARWRSNGASPFGICLRPSGEEVAEQPFAGWSYSPGYLPSGVSIHIASSSDRIEEPLLFVATHGRSPAGHEQPKGLGRVKRVRIEGLPAEWSDAARAAAETPGLDLVAVGDPLMTLQFRGLQAECDFRPALPLRIRGVAYSGST